MRCPNRKCRRAVTRVVITADRQGKVRRGCPNCLRHRRERVRTDRKIWPAYEVYGVNKTIEKNHEWIENMSRKAAHMRRTAFVPHSMRGQ